MHLHFLRKNVRQHVIGNFTVFIDTSPDNVTVKCEITMKVLS